MTTKWHISKQGIPRVCTAKPGNCPFGGDDSHYLTFEAAQTASQAGFEEEFQVLPTNKGNKNKSIFNWFKKSNEDVNEGKVSEELNRDYPILSKEASKGLRFTEKDSRDLETMINNLEELDNLDPRQHNSEKSKYDLINEKNPEILMHVLEGNVDLSNDPRNIELVLRNPHLPREFIDKVVAAPNLYSIETQRLLMTSTVITHDDIMSVFNKSDDLTTKTIAMRNPALDPKFVEDFIENRSDELTELPWVNMAENVMHYETFYEFNLKRMNGEVDVDEVKLAWINQDYQDFTPSWYLND